MQVLFHGFREFASLNINSFLYSVLRCIQVELSLSFSGGIMNWGTHLSNIVSSHSVG